MTGTLIIILNLNIISLSRWSSEEELIGRKQIKACSLKLSSQLQAGPFGPTLELTHLEEGPSGGRLCWFARTGAKQVTEKNIETEIAGGVVVGSAVQAFRALLTEIYLPSLAAQENGFSSGHQQTVTDFIQVHLPSI